LLDGNEVVHRYRWVIMAVLWCAYVVVFIQRLSIGPLSPFLKEEMDLNNSQIGLLVSAFVFGTMFSLLPAGWTVDRVGIRRVLLIGEIVAGSFMLGMFWAPSYQIALIIMGCAGFGCGFLSPATTKGVIIWFPRRERAIVMGIKQTSVNVGGMITAALLPTVAIAMGWHFGFLIIGITAISIGIVSFVLYKDPPVLPVPPANDDMSSVDSVASSSSLSLRELLKARDIWFLALASWCLIIVEYGTLTHLVLYLTEDLHIPVVAAGALLALTEGGGVLGKPGSGVLSDRVFGSSRKRVFMLWAGIACAMCLLVAFRGSSLSWGLYPILFILGVTAIGWGGLYLTLVGELAGVELAGRIASIVSLIVISGVALGPWLFGYIVDTSNSYQLAWLCCAALSAVCIIALLFVREERRRI